MQVLVTPEGYLVITSAVGLILVKDYETAGEQVGLTIFGKYAVRRL